MLVRNLIIGAVVGGIKKHTGIGCDLFFNKQTISWH